MTSSSTKLMASPRSAPADRPPRRPGRLVAALVVPIVGVAGLAVSGVATVGAAPLCTVQQLTDTAGGGSNASTNAAISARGDEVAFDSGRDHIGQNPENNREVFLIDLTTGSMSQVTDASAGASFRADLSGDGNRVAFSSTADLTGDNDDGSTELFLYDRTTDDTSQLTSTPADRTSAQASLSGDGSRVAFHSDADLTGANPDGENEVFLQVISGSTTQHSTSPEALSLSPSISFDGLRFAYSSSGDPLGTNPENNSEIFLRDTSPLGRSQITSSTSGASTFPSLSADARRVAFESTADLTGDNADGSSEVFLHDRLTGTTTQISSGSGTTSARASISAGGTRVAFQSNADLSGENADGNTEIFFYDLLTGTTVQVTDVNLGESLNVAISGDGTRLAFQSWADLTGGNPDGNAEIFLATCGAATPSFPDVGTGHPFFAEVEWLSAAGVSTGFADGTFRPGATVSRQAMSAFMYRLAGSPPFVAPPTASFPDVSSGHPFFAEVEWLSAAGVSTGFADGTFRPGATVSRQAMSAFMYRLAAGPGVHLN